MSSNIKSTVVEFFKNNWWLAPILLIVLVLYIIPAQGGLPDDNYVGCEVSGAVCQYSKIESLSKESDGSATISFNAKITETKNQLLTYNLPSKSAESYSVGNTIFMNYAPNEKRLVLFVGTKSNLLTALTLDQVSSPAATAVISTDTGKAL